MYRRNPRRPALLLSWDGLADCRASSAAGKMYGAATRKKTPRQVICELLRIMANYAAPAEKEAGSAGEQPVQA